MAMVLATPSLSKKPFRMNPNSPVNLVHLHLEEVRVMGAIQAAEVEVERVSSASPTNQSSAAIMPPDAGFRPLNHLYSAAVNKTAGSTSGLCPEGVLVVPIPVSGSTRDDAIAAIVKSRLKLALNSDSNKQQFCFLGNGRANADGGDRSLMDPTPSRARIPDLNFSPPDPTVPVPEFVGVLKCHNISQFTDFVVSYLGRPGSSEDELAEYIKILSSISELQLGNMDSIRIWNILTLGGEIQKALVDKGIIERPICVDDLQFPPPKEQLLAPPPGYKRAASDNETLSDARNYDPYDLPIKKARHDGALRINEANASIHEVEEGL